jgi:hypothetical protein
MNLYMIKSAVALLTSHYIKWTRMKANSGDSTHIPFREFLVEVQQRKNNLASKKSFSQFKVESLIILRYSEYEPQLNRIDSKFQ